MSIVLAPRWGSSSLQLTDNAYVQCSTSEVLSNINDFSLEVWVNPSNLSGFQALLGNADNATGGQFQLYLSDGFVVAYVGMAPFVIMSPEKIAANSWQHIASTFDGSTNTLTLYVNGTQVATQSFGGKLPQAGSNTLIGAINQDGNPTWHLQGQIGRIMVWDSVRSPEDILNDSVQVEIYQAVENKHLLLYVDFSTLPNTDSSGNNVTLNYHDANYLFNVPSVILGDDGYAQSGPNPQQSLPGNLPYTIEGWFFPQPGNNGTLVSFGDDTQWEYQVCYQDNQVIGRRNSDSLQIQTNHAIVPNSYYHFALTYDDRVKTLSLYINGNLQTTTYFPNAVKAVPNGRLLVGAQLGTGNVATDFFGGSIQNIRLWDVCLEQSEIFQWMFNDVISDNRLIANFDFTVEPPVDATDNATLSLHGSAIANIQSLPIQPTESVALLGLPKSINAIYLNQTAEPIVPPINSPGFAFCPQPKLFTADHKQASWLDIVKHLNIDNDQHQKQHYRAKFDQSFASAQTIMDANPQLKAVFTRTDAVGMTRIIHHGIRGDTLVYEGAIGAESDCTLWWIQFVFQLTVGFYQALGLIPATGNIANRIYNLIRENPTAWNALTSLAGKAITATSAIGFMGVLYEQGLMWTVIKFVLTSAGWYALFWVLKKVIAIVTGLEAAAVLTGFIVWAAQLTILSLNHNDACGTGLCHIQSNEKPSVTV